MFICRYEPNYAPNVSLAPVQKCKGEDDDEDEIPEPTDTKERVKSPEPGSSKSYREWDLSESDDSSLEQMSPADGKLPIKTSMKYFHKFFVMQKIII